jgi:hypothetical protein
MSLPFHLVYNTIVVEASHCASSASQSADCGRRRELHAHSSADRRALRATGAGRWRAPAEGTSSVNLVAAPFIRRLVGLGFGHPFPVDPSRREKDGHKRHVCVTLQLEPSPLVVLIDKSTVNNPFFGFRSPCSS